MPLRDTLYLSYYWCRLDPVLFVKSSIKIKMIGREGSFFLPYQQPHDDVIKWKHFPCYWPFVRGTHRSSVNSHHKGQWRGPLMFSSICAWINGWVNKGEAGDLRRHRAHYIVIVMRRSSHIMPTMVSIMMLPLSWDFEFKLHSKMEAHYRACRVPESFL